MPDFRAWIKSSAHYSAAMAEKSTFHVVTVTVTVTGESLQLAT
jgi:heme-degrading monooxygenase HmoA